MNRNFIKQLFEFATVVLSTVFYIIYYTVIDVFKVWFATRLKSVKNEIVLITGGGQGIGKELAFLYGAEGATVIVCDIDVFNGENVVEELNQLGYNSYFFKCDVSNRPDVVKLAEKIQNKIGNVTILINNAGIVTESLLHQSKQVDIERVMNVNIMAHFWTIQAFLPSMIQNRKGHVVGISSIVGLSGIPNAASYAASKFAVRGMMQCLYQENRINKTNIQFTTILPYFADTKLFDMTRIKMLSFLPLLKPKMVAGKIMEAQRKSLQEVTIPHALIYYYKLQEFFPQPVVDYLVDLYKFT